MLQQVRVNGVHFEVDEKLKKYITKKIGKLDRYMPKHARQSATAEAVLKEEKLKTKKNCVCEVLLHLPHDRITVKETTMNMYAAVDIVEAKLKNQLKRYKEKHDTPRLHRRLLRRIRGQAPPEVA